MAIADRLLEAWRRKPNLTLGQLLVYAVDQEAFGASVSMSGMGDDGLVRCLERYAGAPYVSGWPMGGGGDGGDDESGSGEGGVSDDERDRS